MRFQYDHNKREATFVYEMSELPCVAEVIMNVVRTEPHNKDAAIVLQQLLIDIQEISRCTFVSPTSNLPN